MNRCFYLSAVATPPTYSCSSSQQSWHENPLPIRFHFSTFIYKFSIFCLPQHQWLHPPFLYHWNHRKFLPFFSMHFLPPCPFCHACKFSNGGGGQWSVNKCILVNASDLGTSIICINNFFIIFTYFYFSLS